MTAPGAAPARLARVRPDPLEVLLPSPSAPSERHAGTAAALLAGSVLLVASTIVSPAMRTDNVAQLRLVAEHPDRQYISAVIALVAFAVLVPAVLGLAALLRPIRPGLARTGAGLAIAGLVATACSTGLGLLEWQMVKGHLDRAQMVALLDQLESSGGMAAVFFAGALVSVGLLVLAVALAITRRLPVPLAAGLALGPIGVDLGFTVNSLPVAIAGGTLMALGYAAVAAYLVRTSGSTRRARDWSVRRRLA